MAFVLRFGSGVLPNSESVIQADDTIYVAAVSGTVTDVTSAAAREPDGS